MTPVRKVELRNLRDALPNVITSFIGRIGFEGRSASLFDALRSCQFDIDGVHLFESVGADHLRRRWDLPSNVHLYPLEVSDATQVLAMLHGVIACVASAVASSAAAMHVVVDITAFRREELLLMYRLLLQNVPDPDAITFAYVPAQSYSEHWLSRGVAGFRSILGFTGEPVPSKSNHLVVMLGFEVDRAKAIIESYEPSRISIGTGGSGISISEEFHRRNSETLHSFLRFNSLHNVQEFEFSAIDPVAAADTLERVIDSVGADDFNHTIAPLNTKLSALGAGLVGVRRPEVQLCYAPAQEYNEADYSVAADYAYFIRFRDIYLDVR